MNPFALVGRLTMQLTYNAGDIVLFLLKFLAQVFRFPLYLRLYFKQCEKIGVDSLPIVLLTSFFTGGVLALQSYNGFSNETLASSQVGSVVALSMLRELGPVLASLMVAGRVGAAIAAEIGTMRVTEQIDALVTLATNPFKYLVAPRLIAGILMLPPLVAVADIIGIFGAYLVGTQALGFNPASYLDNTFSVLEWSDVISGLVKAAIFGFLIALMGAYHGFQSQGGAQGVG